MPQRVEYTDRFNVGAGVQKSLNGCQAPVVLYGKVNRELMWPPSPPGPRCGTPSPNCQTPNTRTFRIKGTKETGEKLTGGSTNDADGQPDPVR